MFCVGDPALDRFLDVPPVDEKDLFAELAFPRGDGPYAVVIKHILNSESEKGWEQMSATLDAVRELDMDAVVIYPNSDPGGQDIIRAIEHHLPSMPRVRAYRNLPRNQFVNLLRGAGVLIGNSSLGLIESPMLKLPVVNVGNRQKGREHSENVIFVGHGKQEIMDAVGKCLNDQVFIERVRNCVNPYGDGASGVRIAKILAEIQIDERLLVKEFTY